MYSSSCLSTDVFSNKTNINITVHNRNDLPGATILGLEGCDPQILSRAAEGRGRVVKYYQRPISYYVGLQEICSKVVTFEDK